MTNGEVHTSKLDELRVVHQGLPRHDQAEKIAGTTRYAGDLAFAGMLHARLVRSVLPSARLTRRDAAAAREVPGVVAVLFGEDVPHNEIRVDVPGQTIAVTQLKASMQVLATDRVRFHGEPVALVIAETEDALATACERVEIEYDELPVVSDPEEALGEGAPEVHPGGNLLAEWKIERGDVDDAFARADAVIEGEYRTQFVDHAYLEPEAGVGWLDDDGVLTLRVATQVIEHYRDVARILGVSEAKVRVIAPYVGGGFGGKEDMTVEPYLALAVHYTRRPVRMQWTRNESLLARAKRHRNVMRYRTAAASDGRLLAQDIEIVSDAGAYAYLSALVLLYSSVHACWPLPRRQRARAGPDRLHEQPSDQRLPGLRRDAGRARLRVADRRARDAARDRPGRHPQAERAREGRPAASRPGAAHRGVAGADDRRGARARRRQAGTERSAQSRRPCDRVEHPVLRPARVVERQRGRVDRVPDGRVAHGALRRARHRRGPGVLARADRLGDPRRRRRPDQCALRRQRAHPARRHHHGHAPAADVGQRDL